MQKYIFSFCDHDKGMYFRDAMKYKVFDEVNRHLLEMLFFFEMR